MVWREVGIGDAADLLLVVQIKQQSCCQQALLSGVSATENQEVNSLKQLLRERPNPKIFLWDDTDKYLFIIFSDDINSGEIWLHWLGGWYKPTQDMSGMPNLILRDSFGECLLKIKEYLVSRGETVCYAYANAVRMTTDSLNWINYCGNFGGVDYTALFPHVTVVYNHTTKIFTLTVIP